jgi:acetylornithine/succinyldiaminopimelate/putrescine aminotransferase
LLMLKAGVGSIRLRPSLSVTDDDIAEFSRRLTAALHSLRRERAGSDGARP